MPLYLFLNNIITITNLAGCCYSLYADGDLEDISVGGEA